MLKHFPGGPHQSQVGLQALVAGPEVGPGQAVVLRHTLLQQVPHRGQVGRDGVLQRRQVSRQARAPGVHVGHAAEPRGHRLLQHLLDTDRIPGVEWYWWHWWSFRH